MKIGVIGIGNIAQKAYLPLYAVARGEAEFYFASSKESTRKKLQADYGFKEVYSSQQEILDLPIEGVMIHAATVAHYPLIKTALEKGLHVFVDKPLTEDLAQTKELLALAKAQGKILMAGFNRRFAPLVGELKKAEEKQVLILQKHRVNEPQPLKFVIYDLFLHLVDTAVFLLDEDIQGISGRILQKDGLLTQAHLQLDTAKTTAFLHMDLASGTNLENYQLTTKNGRFELSELTQLTKTIGQEKIEIRSSDWATTLAKRGFEPMFQAFLKGVKTGEIAQLRQENILQSHEICQEFLQKVATLPGIE